MPQVDLNLLIVLEAIYSAGGITRAGERLNLTQSAISHALARLRAQLGDPLFVRHGHALVATPITRRLIAPLRQSLRELGVLFERAGRFDPQTANTCFTIGLRDPLEILVLPAVMRHVAVEAPGVDIRTAQIRRREVEASLVG